MENLKSPALAAKLKEDDGIQHLPSAVQVMSGISRKERATRGDENNDNDLEQEHERKK